MAEQRPLVLPVLGVLLGASGHLHGAPMIEVVVIAGVAAAIGLWRQFESARTHRVREQAERERLRRG